MDGVINELPQPFTKYACSKQNQLNFHVKTREACKNGAACNVSLKVSKSIVIGDMSVGKTSLVNRYCHNVFEKDYKPTIGVEYELRKYKILEQEFHLQMWDTSGEERFRCITGAYYRGAHAVIVVFDISDITSLQNAGKWMEDALEKTRSTTPDLFLVANKIDLVNASELEATRESALDVANQLNAEYWEVSAKTGANVRELFARVAAICFDQAVLRETSYQKQPHAQMGGLSSIKCKNQPQTDIIVLSASKNENGIDEEKDNRKRCCR